MNSRVFYAECTAFPSPMLVKFCLKSRTSQADPDAAQRQYDALLRVSSSMGNGTPFSVPRPYAVRSELGLLATEWIEGKTMSELLFSWRCPAAQAEELMRRAGRWVRHFHDCHALAPGPLDVGRALPFIAEMETSAVPDPVFIRAVKWLRESAETAASVNLDRSWIHGDFKTDNLIVSGSRTVGIDIHLRHEGVTIYDLAPFLNELELRLLQPTGWRIAGALARLRTALLKNYNEDAIDALALPLRWLQLYMILGRWHTAHARIGTAPRFRFRAFCYRRVASRLTGTGL
jgi:tRNA A-37 threonylcarbamoyl transferase component Bud32